MLKLEKEEKVIKSFAVKFFDIEEAKNPEDATTKGKVQTCQSLSDANNFFLRITYISMLEKKVKSFKIEADWLIGNLKN